MSAVTYYQNDGIASNGHSYTQNLRRYGAVCASNHWPLGSVVVLTAPSGRRMRLTVCDRVGYIRGRHHRRVMSTDYDVDPTTAQKLFGSRYKVIGRFSVHARLVSLSRSPPGTAARRTRRTRKDGGQ